MNGYDQENSQYTNLLTVLSLIPELSLPEKNTVILKTLRNQDITVEELQVIFKTLFKTSDDSSDSDLSLFSKPVIDLIDQLIKPFKKGQPTPDCPKCRSSKVVRYGIRDSKQRYLCKSCNHHFIK